ncbi:hypothetical protein HFP51_09760 [Parasphingopyxis sp. CP4]|uniref:LytR C-terminal domain-containing protein n=1 Tax=Parasphingopyxis sp. CP4 TaxID=2724527 RepID=UPI0015A275A4|nr:LytR C-terminal domain-containing protein [Parasphingopyxis sp. CP4]QLC22440.1 hypothetical protein HFP51_09760 [Parasphingopyxis sp. CP4]
MSRKLLNISALALLVGCTSGNVELRAVQTHPDAAVEQNRLLEHARGLFRSGNYALAAQQFRAAIRHDNQNAAAYNGLAACYDQMQRFDLADRYYQEALALAPADRAVRHNYTLSLRMQRRTDEAEAFELETAALERQAVEQRAEALRSEEQVAPSVAPIIVASATIVDVEPEVDPELISAQLVGELAEAVPQITAQAPEEIEPIRPIEARATVQTAELTTSVSLVHDPDEQREWSWQIAQATPSVSRDEAWERIASAVAPAMAMDLVRRPIGRMIASADYGDASLKTTKAGLQASWGIANAEVPAIDQPITVLNGVGRRGQAARMRTHLRTLGASQIRVGDARRMREGTALYFAASDRDEAETLAQAIPIPMEMRERNSNRQITLVLGENSVPFDYMLQARFIAL